MVTYMTEARLMTLTEVRSTNLSMLTEVRYNKGYGPTYRATYI